MIVILTSFSYTEHLGSFVGFACPAAFSSYYSSKKQLFQLRTASSTGRAVNQAPPTHPFSYCKSEHKTHADQSASMLKIEWLVKGWTYDVRMGMRESLSRYWYGLWDRKISLLLTGTACWEAANTDGMRLNDGEGGRKGEETEKKKRRERKP